MGRSGRRPPGRPKVAEQVVPTAEGIAEAAGRLFLRLGCREVSVERVARQAGVTKAAVYYHFADKGELITRAVLRLTGPLVDESRAILEGPDPLPARLRRLADLWLRSEVPAGGVERLLGEAEGELSAAQRALLAEQAQALPRVLAEALAKAQEKGEVGPWEGPLVAHALVALLDGAVRRRLAGDPLGGPPAEEAARLVQLLWEGLAP